jgi:hypothetical protein
MDITSDDFLNYCRDSVRQLMRRGSWWASVQPVTACARSGTITWPRGAATVLAMNECGHPLVLENRWFQFMQPDSRHRTWATEYSRQGWGGQIRAESWGQSPVFNPITANGFTIRTFITQQADVGKTITFYGIDNNGQIIQSYRPDGTFQDGIQVVMASPYADTPITIRHVSRIVKQVTSGTVNCFQYNVAQGFMLDLGRYQATETNPDYICTTVLSRFPGEDCQRNIEALVKFNFVPFKFQDDLVQIDCEDAIRDMLISLRKKESGDIAAAQAYEISAIRELNYQMKSRFPDEQFVVNFRPFGRDDLNNCNTRVGMI